MSDDELAAEADATAGMPGQTIITVPDALLPVIRQLLARPQSAQPAL